MTAVPAGYVDPKVKDPPPNPRCTKTSQVQEVTEPREPRDRGSLMVTEVIDRSMQYTMLPYATLFHHISYIGYNII